MEWEPSSESRLMGSPLGRGLLSQGPAGPDLEKKEELGQWLLHCSAL